jgi:signal peptidase II
MGAIVALDQLTKNAVLSAIGIGGAPVAVINNFFYIVCHRNSGAAWGLFQNGRYFFVILTAVVFVFIGYTMFKVKDRMFRVLASIFAGGALGNFADRLLHGSVVDFLDFYIFGYNFPTFNVADSFIVIGTFLLVIYLLKNKGILTQFEQKSS